MSYFILFFIVISSNVYSQNQQPIAEEIVEETPESKFEQIKTDRVQRIRNELVSLYSKIRDIKKRDFEAMDMVERIKTDTRLKKLEEEYDKKRFLFIETITNISLNQRTKGQEKTSFSDDLKQILDPALNSFKKLSERPRQIQELEERMNQTKTRYEDAQNARLRLEEFYKNNKNKSLDYQIKVSIREAKDLEKELKVKLDDLEFKLLKYEKNKESIVTTFSSLILEFIKTKGKNLLLSIFVFVGVFWGFRLAENKVIQIILFRRGKSANQEFYEWIIRPTKVIYSAVSSIVALFLSVLTLYVLNDWVLVTFIIFVVAALVWSSKQYLPVFLEQSKIVLNLGAVREGERIVFNGIPWKVDSLGYYCKLVNPELSFGTIRINTRELLNLNSRKVSSLETWFPTTTGDWIKLGDVFGKVVFQSPEQVIIEQIGGLKKYMSSTDFFSAQPENLSRGFAISIQFGLDYSHQKILFDEVIPNIENELKMNLYNDNADIKESFEDFSVEFMLANASSLDLRIFLRCNGKIASGRMKLERYLQAQLVKACNKYDYNIPFNQLTVHMNAQ